MTTSANSDFSLPDWAPPWRIDRPAHTKPPAGPERDAWLAHRTLFRARHTLKSVLDRIDPAIARNEPVTALNEDDVATALLEFLEKTPDEISAERGKGRMPVRNAQTFLEFFARGFRQYCQFHGLRAPRLPLIREYSLEEGSLQANLFDSLREYRRSLGSVIAAIDRRVISPSAQALSPEEAAALITCSSALCGGLARKRHWAALVSALSQPLQSDGNIVWLSLDAPAPYRWIADPVTEGLLRRLCERKILPLPEGTKTPDKAIRRILDAQAGVSSISEHLQGLVRTAHVRHFAPDVASVAQGLIPNTPLAIEPWLRLISGTRHVSDRAKVSLSIPRIVPTAHADTLEQVELDAIIEAIATAVRWDAKSKRRQGAENPADEKPTKKYSTDAKRALRTCRGRLEDLYVKAGHPERHSRSFAYGLLCYAEDLLELGGLKVRQLAPSTIDRYVGIVRKHLNPLRFADLVELGTEAREDAYREDIRQQLVRERNDHRTAFEGFERSLLRHFEMIDEVDWATIPGRAKQRHLPKADANIIDPGLYRHLFKLLDKPAKENPIVELARVLLVILYRFGLRTGEAAEVTQGALQFHGDGCASLWVTRSAITSRKSGNAVRRVGPVKLEDDEFTLLQDYSEQRASGATQRGGDLAKTHLFATDGTRKLDQIEPAQQLLMETLRAASGDTNLRPRHLRHSFVSAQYLAGRAPLGCLGEMALTNGPDAWQRTFATGHASPETGIISYTHVNEIAHYHHACRLVSEEVSLSFLSQLAGNDARSLERSRLRNASGTVADVFLQSLRRNFPCTDIPNALAHRVGYLRVTPRRDAQPTKANTCRLTWVAAWSVYANARVGRIPSDVSDHAGVIRRRVRELETGGRIARRTAQRPQLEPTLESVAAALWPQVQNDTDLQETITTAVSCLRPRAQEIGMPTSAARQLKQRLERAGLTGLQSRPGNRGHCWLWRADERTNFSTTWQELLAFLYCGQPSGTD